MKGIDIMYRMYDKLKKYFKRFDLLKEVMLDDRNIYVFDYFGYYLFVYCDKQNNVLDNLVSEYY